MIIFRKAERRDLPGVLQLQKANLLKNLGPRDQQDGFLSLNAHQDKLGMKVLDEFQFNGQKYITLMFDVGPDRVPGRTLT